MFIAIVVFHGLSLSHTHTKTHKDTHRAKYTSDDDNDDDEYDEGRGDLSNLFTDVVYYD